MHHHFHSHFIQYLPFIIIILVLPFSKLEWESEWEYDFKIIWEKKKLKRGMNYIMIKEEKRIVLKIEGKCSMLRSLWHWLISLFSFLLLEM